ncbi:class I SAM-dependent methyltransferase [Micromonospora sp. NPDC048871]|uniref:SAM-dependent methyltransferase n=1 Tax=unclassified Micromonospora TaxID=2617518 RepID=UPI002E0F8D80|nr:methyltransferase domain-containing protein [Micromonospora sp. NBC_01739]
MDLPRQFVIREGGLRILNPFDAEKLATLGRALKLAPGTTILDLCSGKGELLCTWARDHGGIGTGVDISTAFTAAARQRAVELGVAEQVSFLHGDAASYDCEEPVDVAACVGATWIGDGVPGTLEILARGLRPGGMALIGEPYWRIEPPDQATVEGCDTTHRDDFHDLPGLVGLFGDQGWDLVEMVLADQDSWDRYAAAHWLNLRRWLDDNPDDPLAPELRQELTEDPLRHVRYRRDHLGWGVFVLIRR